MYKIIECDQRSPEWFSARAGLATGSVFDKFITAAKGERSSSADEMINRLVAEKITGVPDETFQSEAMLRGKELEDEALKFLEFTHGLNFKSVGFLDSGKGYGCSPDGLDEAQRVGLELKCPSAHTHIEYISNGYLPKKYRAQVQGAMLVTGFDRWVFMSYHPEIRPLVIMVERDEKFIKSLESILLECCEEIQKKYKIVTDYIDE